MSKWLRRGFGQNTNAPQDENQRAPTQTLTTGTTVPSSPVLHHHHHHPSPSPPPYNHSTTTTEFPSPPRNTMPGSASSAAVYHQHHHSSHHPSMGPPYGSVPAPIANNNMAMEIDHPVPTAVSRTKYASNSSSYHPPSTSNVGGKSATPAPGYDPRPNRDDGGSSSVGRSRRSTTDVDRRTRVTPPASSYNQRSSGPGSSSVVPNPPVSQQHHPQSQHHHHTSVPPQPYTSTPTSSAQYHHPQQQQQQQYHHPPPTAPAGPSSTAPPPLAPTPYKNAPLGTSTTPPDAVQPSYPPPAVTAESPPSTDSTQQRRPAYLLHRDLVIGKGSYGQVCIASRGEPEGHSSGRQGKRKKFACKCVMLRNDPKYIAKLQEEVNVLRELRGHDNVIRLYDVFCVDNELFIITELGRGGDLFHLLTTHPKHGVTEAYAAKTVAEMLSAVAFLHSRSICHRDLKLENWVLESGKDVWSPLKLIDFGLSTHFSPGQRLSRVVGSSYYVAPEVLKKSYTEACDLWSLGVIVYMLLSGAPPFYGKNDEAIKASIVQGEYTFPHELFRDVSDEAMAFVSTLLSYNIEYRYTAEQALTHPWLANNIDRDALRKATDGARGIGIQMDNGSRLDPMQM